MPYVNYDELTLRVAEPDPYPQPVLGVDIFDEAVDIFEEVEVIPWCREKFGEPGRSLRWFRPYRGWIRFKDERDAMLFKMRFG